MKKLKVIVELYGGVVNSVRVDQDVEVDVVVLEDSKYCEGKEFEVASGEYAGAIIYSHHDATQASKEDVEAVFAAAEARLKASENE